MTNREKLWEQIARKVGELATNRPWEEIDTWVQASAYLVTDAILALPNLQVKAEDQSLPQPPAEADGKYVDRHSYRCALQDILDDGFVKVEKP